MSNASGSAVANSKRPSPPAGEWPPTHKELRQHLTVGQLGDLQSLQREGDALLSLLRTAEPERLDPHSMTPLNNAHVKGMLGELRVAQDLLKRCSGFAEGSWTEFRIAAGECVHYRSPWLFIESDPRSEISRQQSLLVPHAAECMAWLTVAARTQGILAPGAELTYAAMRQLSFATNASMTSWVVGQNELDTKDAKSDRTESQQQADSVASASTGETDIKDAMRIEVDTQKPGDELTKLKCEFLAEVGLVLSAKRYKLAEFVASNGFKAPWTDAGLHCNTEDLSSLLRHVKDMIKNTRWTMFREDNYVVARLK